MLAGIAKATMIRTMNVPIERVASSHASFSLGHGLKSKPGDRSQVPGVVQLVETLRYKPEGRGFDSRWNSSLT
jgi:hypothetical protein